MKISFDDARLPLPAPKKASHSRNEFLLIISTLASNCIAFYILISSGFRSGLYPGRRKLCICLGFAPSHSLIFALLCTGWPSRIRKTLRLLWRIKRFRKSMSTSAQKILLKTIKLSRPLLVIAEIILQTKRWPVPGITAVWPRRPYVRPTACSDRNPISSPSRSWHFPVSLSS